mmetsp:Transcript_1703/g.3877  ORF Transcript_1703/g.3877 Transcript_1703/m.3877 type:complete len:349 (+) Transcript_1703:180-1226(+)
MTIDEPFEYLTFGGTFGRTFSLFVDRFDLFMGLSGVVIVPFAVLLLTTSIIAASIIIREEEVPDFHPHHIPAIVLIVLVQLILYELCSVIGQGAVSKAVASVYVGQRPGFGHCLKDAWKMKWSLLGSSVLVYGALCVAFIPAWIFVAMAIMSPNPLTITLAVLSGLAFVGGALYGYIGVVMVSPAIMIETIKNPIQAITRSWELATGSRCYLLCTMFCLWFINQLVARLLHNMFVTGDVMDILFSIVGIVVSIVPMLLFFPLHAILETVLYLNLRIGRESMNHQVLSADLLSDAPSNVSRFRNDDPTVSESHVGDYRHVPLVDSEVVESGPGGAFIPPNTDESQQELV